MRYRNWLILIIFLVSMLWLHQYIFLYADDLYYSRDAQYGWDYLPQAMLDELNLNGRVWVGTAMLLVLKPQIELYRLLNPLILTATVIILAKITTFRESQLNIKQDKPPVWLALLCSSLFFFFLPLQIVHTTIYYAACAFNYLYPMTLALLYAYLLYSSVSKASILSATEKASSYMLKNTQRFNLCHAERLAKYLRKASLLLLAFFVGSSTQQVGMIGIGFTVMISFYLAFVRKKVLFKTFIPYYLLIFFGYGIVTYGSLKRLLWEQTAGNEVVLAEVITALLKTNIFSQPAAPFVLLISLSSIFWLHYFSRTSSYYSLSSLSTAATLSSSENSNSASTDSDYIPSSEFATQSFLDIRPNKNFPSKQCCTNLLAFNRLLSILLSLALLGYVYVLLIREPVEFTSENLLSLYGLCVITFTLVYLFSLVYTAALILINMEYPFLLFNSVNAIGAQIMLIAVDARFAATYKVMFPSLLLLSIYIFYSFLAFRKNVLFLSLAFFFAVLSLGKEFLTIIGLLGLGSLLVLYLIPKVRHSQKFTNIFPAIFAALFILLSLGIFSTNLYGYYRASIPQNYNLQAIKEYHERGKTGELIFKKVTPSYYGYNLGNWITMPYFLKQCYGIKEDTPIRYIE